MTENEILDEQEVIVTAAKKMLSGRHHVVRGAVLVELVSLWLAEYPPALRDEAIACHVSCVRRMVPLCELELLRRVPAEGTIQ